MELCRRALLLPSPPCTMELSSLHCSHLLRGKRCSRLPRIARILFSDGALHLFGSFGSSSRIVRFSSPISRLGWEVFHQINQVRFFIQPIRSGLLTNLTSSAFGFPPQLSHWVRRFFINSMLIDLLVFLLSSPTGLGGFSLIDCSCINPHRPLGARSMILRNLVFSPHLPIYRQEVFSTVPQIGYTTSIAMRSSELAPKKEGNCNAVATKITWLHLSTGISLSQPIAFTYQLIPNGLLPNTPNRIHLLLGIGFPSSHCWNVPARYPTAVSVPTHQHPVCWDSTFLHLDLLKFGSPHEVLRLTKAYRTVSVRLHYEKSW